MTEWRLAGVAGCFAEAVAIRIGAGALGVAFAVAVSKAQVRQQVGLADGAHFLASFVFTQRRLVACIMLQRSLIGVDQVHR